MRGGNANVYGECGNGKKIRRRCSMVCIDYVVKESKTSVNYDRVKLKRLRRVELR